eukprot:g24408.t1
MGRVLSCCASEAPKPAEQIPSGSKPRRASIKEASRGEKKEEKASATARSDKTRSGRSSVSQKAGSPAVSTATGRSTKSESKNTLEAREGDTSKVNTMFILTRFFFMCVGFGQASRLTVSQEKCEADSLKGNGLAWDDDQSRLARIEEIKKQLFDLVGLDKVKESMRTLLDLVEFSKMREKSGMHGFAAQSLHMRFLGNPGTGKTVVARLVGELLLAMGDTWQNQEEGLEAITPVEGGNTSSGFVFKEASRADLVGEHTGATAIKVQGVVKEALGGVLFIDEAYALCSGARDNFGVEAVDTLIKEMEDNRAHLIVILAGYTKDHDGRVNM